MSERRESAIDGQTDMPASGDDVRQWRQDPLIIALVVIIALCGVGLLLLLAIPLLAFALQTIGLTLPLVDDMARWLGNGRTGFVLALTLAVVAVIAIVILRYRVLRNPQYFVEAGCPQCLEHELVRVRRQRADRIVSLTGIPFQRRVCRNCSWEGLRVGGSHFPAQEESLAASGDLLWANDGTVQDSDTDEVEDA